MSLGSARGMFAHKAMKAPIINLGTTTAHILLLLLLEVLYVKSAWIRVENTSLYTACRSTAVVYDIFIITPSETNILLSSTLSSTSAGNARPGRRSPSLLNQYIWESFDNSTLDQRSYIYTQARASGRGLCSV